MRSKMLVVAIAAGLGLASVASVAAPAQAGQSQDMARQSAGQQDTNAEIERLKAELARLQAQVDSLEKRQAQQGGQAGTGQATMSTPGVRSTQVAALDKLVNNTTLSGKMYVDFSNISQKNSDTGKTDASGTGLDVKRFYLGVNHVFNDIWSANLTTDFNYVSSDGETNLFVKKAYVQGKFSDAAVFRVGSADMPWIGFVENYYGFRYVENTLTDRLHYANSADWGLHLGGDLGAGKQVDYAVSVVNGNGYKNPSRSNSVDVAGRIGFAPFENMIVAVGGYSGHLGKETQNVDAQHTARRADLLVAYASRQVRLGGEYFRATDWGNLVLSPVADTADGYSLWGSVGVADNLSVFARYDHARLSKDQDRNASDVYYNLGLQYQVTDGFRLAGVWKHEKADRSVLEPVAPHVQNVKTNELGVFGEVAF